MSHLRMEIHRDHINAETVLRAGRPGHSLTVRWIDDQFPGRHVRHLDATSEFFRESEKVITPVLEYLGQGDHELSPELLVQTYKYLISEQN